MSNTKNVSGCKVYFEGLNLNIELFLATEIDNKQKELKSKYNAQITKVETFAGETKFKVGDIVKAGDILIKSDVEAKGSVFGKVYFTATKIYNEIHNEEVETGNILKTSNISLLNFDLLKSENGCDFKNYKIETEKILLFKNLIVPIYKNNLTFKEISIIEKRVSFEEVETEIKEELKNEALKKLPSDATAKNISYSVVKEDNLVRIDCFIETEISLF